MRLYDRTSSVGFNGQPVWQRIVGEVTAGLFIKAGLDPMLLGQAAANNADRRYPSGCDLREASCEVLEMHGEDPRGMYAGDLIEAAFSTATGSDIFSNLVNTALATGFSGDGDTTQGWVSPKRVDNFKTNRRPRLDQHLPLERVPAGGSAKQAQLNVATAETYKASRYGSHFVVDEQDAVDDDVAAIVAPALVFGREALSLKLNLAYSILLANASLVADSIALFETATHANLATTSGLSAATLRIAIGQMRLQTVEGEPLSVVPRYLIVPVELEDLGRQLLSDREVVGEQNLRLRTEPRLSLGLTDPVTKTAYSGSATTWYLSADADTAPTIEFGYIDTPTPVASRYDLRQGRWGVGFRIHADFGTKALDYRGLHKNTA